jgi:hypothetical protein
MQTYMRLSSTLGGPDPFLTFMHSMYMYSLSIRGVNATFFLVVSTGDWHTLIGCQLKKTNVKEQHTRLSSGTCRSNFNIICE